MKFPFTFLIVLTTFAAPGQNTSNQKNNLGGTARLGAVAFSINNKGYLGTGYLYDGAEHYFNDFWEYDPAADTWTQKADFGGAARHLAVGFSIGSKGYIGTGSDNVFRKDFWEYDPAFNKWIQKADFGGTARGAAFGFSAEGKGYIGTGSDGAALKKDFWQYDPLTDSWIQKADFGGSARYSAAAFSKNGKGYAGTGLEGSTYKKDFWEYDTANDTWMKKADFEGTARYGAVGFTIINGYIGTGYGTAGYCKDIWEYDPQSNTWKQQIDFGGSARVNAVAFSITGKGYIGTGRSAMTSEKDFWDFAPELSTGSGQCPLPLFLYLTDITAGSAILHWSENANAFSFRIRKRPVGTSDWIYVSVAASVTYKKLTNNVSNTLYEVQLQKYCNAAKTDSSGYTSSVYFSSGCISPVITSLSASSNPVCKGNSTTLKVEGALNDAAGWNWYTGSCGETTAGSGTSISVTPDVTTTYFVTGEGGCALSENCSPFKVTVNPSPKAKITALGDLDICTAGYVNLQGGTVNNLTYQWKLNGANITGATAQIFHATQEGEYKVKVTNSFGCSNTSKPVVVYSGCKTSSSANNKESSDVQVYPNPLVTSAIISISIPQDANVMIALYDATGSKLQNIFNDKMIAGTHTVQLQRDGLSAGFYFLKVTIDADVLLKKVIIE
ncbi:MAG: T9SS type A sorting domain-containing protein [Chitinophagaceae bacterium]|nr:T9SS type A sorting domain-containing protein [Chitinophagaceae bacterium]